MPDRPLRILTVADVPCDPDSGAAGTVYHTNVALRELGHEVDEIWAADLGTRRIGHGNLHSLLEQPRAYRDAVRRAVSKKAYDVVQMSQPQAYLAARHLKQQGFRGLVINRSHGLELRVNADLPEWHRKLGVPESRFPRSLMTPVMRQLLERQWPAVARWSDGIVVPSEQDREFLLSALRLHERFVRTIHHGVEAAYAHRPVKDSSARWRRLLYVGQYAFIKGPLLLSRILNRLLADEPEITVTWVTSEQAHDEIAGRLDAKIARRVQLRKWLSQSELRDVYDAHGLFVFPSLFEGAAKAVLEAMSRGLYVVASDTGGMRDYIKSGLNGRLCAVGDVDGFAEALRAALVNTGATCEAARRAREWAVSKTWHACAQGLVAFMSDLRPMSNQHPRVA